MRKRKPRKLYLLWYSGTLGDPGWAGYDTFNEAKLAANAEENVYVTAAIIKIGKMRDGKYIPIKKRKKK